MSWLANNGMRVLEAMGVISFLAAQAASSKNESKSVAIQEAQALWAENRELRQDLKNQECMAETYKSFLVRFGLAYQEGDKLSVISPDMHEITVRKRKRKADPSPQDAENSAELSDSESAPPEKGAKRLNRVKAERAARLGID